MTHNERVPLEEITSIVGRASGETIAFQRARTDGAKLASTFMAGLTFAVVIGLTQVQAPHAILRPCIVLAGFSFLVAAGMLVFGFVYHADVAGVSAEAARLGASDTETRLRLNAEIIGTIRDNDWRWRSRFAPALLIQAICSTILVLLASLAWW